MRATLPGRTIAYNTHRLLRYTPNRTARILLLLVMVLPPRRLNWNWRPVSGQPLIHLPIALPAPPTLRTRRLLPLPQLYGTRNALSAWPTLGSFTSSIVKHRGC